MMKSIFWWNMQIKSCGICMPMIANLVLWLIIAVEKRLIARRRKYRLFAKYRNIESLQNISIPLPQPHLSPSYTSSRNPR